MAVDRRYRARRRRGRRDGAGGNRPGRGVLLAALPLLLASSGCGGAAGGAGDAAVGGAGDTAGSGGAAGGGGASGGDAGGASGAGGADAPGGTGGGRDGDADADAIDAPAGDGASDTGDGRFGLRVFALPGCDGRGPGSEDCHFRVVWDQRACGGGAGRCDRLVVYWSGGEQSCKDGRYDPLLQRYAAEKFIAVCAQPFTNEAEAGRYPVYAEFDRMDHIMARARAEAADLWSGANLLVGGVSHGGTAPLAAIASQRALRDHAAVWTGAAHTAVALYDGISNQAALEEWTATQTGCGLFHARFVGRYGDGTPLLHNCGNGACYCSAPAHAADWAKDTLVIGATRPPSPYACDDFSAASGTVLYRFVSCSGAGAAPCEATGLGDLVPDEQQQKAYDALKSCAGITASWQRYAACGHSACGTWACGGSDSLAWLEGNGW